MTFLARATANNKAEIYIYEGIGRSWDGEGISATGFQKELDRVKNATEIDFYVNSPGGSVFEGIAIYNQIIRHSAKRKTMHVDGIAASIASIIIMAGTERRIASNAMVMIHDPSGMAGGTSRDLRAMADSLDKVRDVLVGTYVNVTKHSAEKIAKWMEDETWMDAKEAKALGFVTEVTEAKAVEANFRSLQNFAKVPPELKRKADSMAARVAAMNMRTRQWRGASPAK